MRGLCQVSGWACLMGMPGEGRGLPGEDRTSAGPVIWACQFKAGPLSAAKQFAAPSSK